MYVGTVHSLCRRILTDRRFIPDRHRARTPRLLDELDQYFHLYQRRRWTSLLDSIGLDGDANLLLNDFFSLGLESKSRHRAVRSCIALFNRLSEECIDPERALDTLRTSEAQLQSAWLSTSP